MRVGTFDDMPSMSWYGPVVVGDTVLDRPTKAVCRTYGATQVLGESIYFVTP